MGVDIDHDHIGEVDPNYRPPAIPEVEGAEDLPDDVRDGDVSKGDENPEQPQED
jgi:hypothetical protein